MISSNFVLYQPRFVIPPRIAWFRMYRTVSREGSGRRRERKRERGRGRNVVRGRGRGRETKKGREVVLFLIHKFHKITA